VCAKSDDYFSSKKFKQLFLMISAGPKKIYQSVSTLIKGLSLAYLLFLSQSCKTAHNMSSTTIHAFRLKPGEDLKQGIQQVVKDHHIKAGWVSTCVGSLTEYRIRFANQEGISEGFGHFEIVSLTGTVSINGSHIHMSISDSTGKTIGGHLADGNKVYTTAEIVIMSTSSMEFKREKDGTTPWEELQVEIKGKE
jgi:hypothetical protein